MKEVELDAQLQVLRHSEWQKRVALERENTVLQEKLAAHERFGTTNATHYWLQHTRFLLINYVTQNDYVGSLWSPIMLCKRCDNTICK